MPSSPKGPWSSGEGDGVGLAEDVGRLHLGPLGRQAVGRPASARTHRPLVGDADGDDVVAVGVGRGQHVGRGHARDVVLGRAARRRGRTRRTLEPGRSAPGDGRGPTKVRV